jgi:hypothetical protein
VASTTSAHQKGPTNFSFRSALINIDLKIFENFLAAFNEKDIFETSEIIYLLFSQMVKIIGGKCEKKCDVKLYLAITYILRDKKDIPVSISLMIACRNVYVHTPEELAISSFTNIEELPTEIMYEMTNTPGVKCVLPKTEFFQELFDMFNKLAIKAEKKTQGALALFTFSTKRVRILRSILIKQCLIQGVEFGRANKGIQEILHGMTNFASIEEEVNKLLAILNGEVFIYKKKM